MGRKFSYDGEYVFKGCDNKGQLYLDNNKVMDLGGFKGMDPKEKIHEIGVMKSD